MANFEWYRSFVSIYREGSVSTAAQLRHMTQPALSQHLSGLEAAIGEPLFVRTPRKMVPTDRGKMLYSQISQAVDRLERTTGQLKGTKTKTIIRLGSPAEYFHERVLKNVSKLNNQLIVSFGLSEDLLYMLQDNRLDVVISTQKLSIAGIQYARLRTETFHLVGRKPLSISDPDEGKTILEAMRWISYGIELPIIRRFWLETFGEKPAFSPSLVVPDLRTIKQGVLRGDGISVLPDYLITHELNKGTLCELWRATKPVSNVLWLAYRATDQTDIVIQDFIASCMDD